MKIISREKFLSMPAGTLFSKYKPCVFDNLEIKGESLANDYCFQQIVDAIDCNDSGEFSDLLLLAQHEGTSVNLDFECEGRDGCFDEDQLFAVWEAKDVQQLIERLQRLTKAH